MPDWKKVVHKRMATLKPRSNLKGEVTAELAAHMEELYEQAALQDCRGKLRSELCCKKWAIGTI